MIHSPITVTTPGTCGELIQGWHPKWRQPVLVSCPIARYSTITVQLRSDHQQCYPDGLPKIQQAIRLALHHLNKPKQGLMVSRQSDLPLGRGMASSTADVVGVLQGVAVALGHPLDEVTLAYLACQIEPSDSTMFRVVTLLAYQRGTQFIRLDPFISLSLLVLDTAQPVDTVMFNQTMDLKKLRRLGGQTLQALDLLKRGLRQKLPVLIGAATTLSSRTYQQMHYSPWYPIIQNYAEQTHALGVVRAHSGGVWGLLYATPYHLQAAQQQINLPNGLEMWSTRLVAGGAKVTTTHPGGQNQ